MKIFFHLGLERTGTTFLQHHVFPWLKNVTYVKGALFRQVEKIIADVDTDVFISYELGKNFDKEVESFAKKYPETQTIIVIREPSAWVASQYRRYVKNGYSGGFHKFCNIENTASHFNQDDLMISRKLRLLQKLFSKKPLVLDYQSLQSSPQELIKSLVDELRLDIRWDRIKWNPKHTSYDDKVLLRLRSMNRSLNMKTKSSSSPGRVLLVKILRYTIILLGRILPPPSGVFIPEDELKQIQEYCQFDWQECQEWLLHS